MKGDEAIEVFGTGFSCAQAVLVPFARESGLGDTAASMASSFGAGMGRMQKTCGAVTGGFMALGLARGFTRGDDLEGKARALRLTKELAALFKAEFGTLSCKDLVGCDLDTDEGQKYHLESGQRETVCGKCVRFAAEAVEKILARP
jgi:C_GCAxxG_C_C family probable redox protein